MHRRHFLWETVFDRYSCCHFGYYLRSFVAGKYYFQLIGNLFAVKYATAIELFKQIHNASFFIWCGDCIYCSNTSNIDIAPATRPIMFSLSFNTVLFNNIYKDFSIYYRPNRTRSLCSDKVHNELYTLTAIRAHILMASVCVISVINVSVNTIGAYCNNRSLLRGITAFFDVLVFIFVVALQIRTVVIMKRRVAETENSEVLNQSNAKIIKLFLHMMLLFMVCTIPFNMISFIRFLLVNHLQGYSRSHIEFF